MKHTCSNCGSENIYNLIISDSECRINIRIDERDERGIEYYFHIRDRSYNSISSCLKISELEELSLNLIKFIEKVK
jgi:hypothetical protein